ncbi:hypothetical protein BOX15_Mlig005458g1, partial [Macrostomum lignano]
PMSKDGKKPYNAEAERARIARLFKQLDKDGDGRISASELSAALKQQYGQEAKRLEAAERVIQASDSNADAGLDMDEFVRYVTDQNRRLRLAFKELDKNKDDRIDAEEIQAAMLELGIKLNKAEAEQLLNKLDKDGSLSINYEEWRDFLLLTGRHSVDEIFMLMRRASSFDIGESFVIPDDYTPEERQSGVAWKTLVSGGLAGAVSRSATAPLDRLKVAWQASAGSKDSHGAKASMWRGIAGMVTEGGVASLWRGNGVNCIKIAPESAIKFLAYETYKGLIVGESKRPVQLHEKFVAGALAGATAQTLIYPLEVLKTRMCLRKTGQYSSLFDCARKVYAEGGAAIFYRGYVPNMLGILPYAGIDLALYETFKQTYQKWRGNESGSPPIYVSLVAGAVSSVCGQVATYPLALVRTKLQARIGGGGGLGSMFADILKREGVRGLYRGMGPNMLKVIPAVSISYATFDEMRRRLGLIK